MTALIIASIAGMVACYFVGRRRGRAEGWLEHFFDTIAKDRARRDAAGRFRGISK